MIKNLNKLMAGGRNMKRSVSNRGPKGSSTSYKVVKAPRTSSGKVKWR